MADRRTSEREALVAYLEAVKKTDNACAAFHIAREKLEKPEREELDAKNHLEDMQR